MQILFFFTTAGHQKMAFEIQTEILLDHLQRGDQVAIVIDSERDVFKAQAWHPSDPSSKFIYKSLFNKLIKLIEDNGYASQLTILPYLLKDDLDTPLKEILTLSTIEDVKNIHYKNYQIGIPVASSLISYYRDHGLDIYKYRKELLRELKIAEEVLDTIEYYYHNIEPELVYVFNGRMAHNAPVFIYCKSNNIDCRVFEFTLTFDKYHILENAIPHDIEVRNKEMHTLWNDHSISQEKKIEVAKNFFESQKQGNILLGKSFVELQNQFESNLNIIKGKKIISFFNSSIDEYASVPGWDEYIYIFENEVDAIFSICQRYIDDNSKHFVLRIHPNLKFLDNTQTKELKKLESLQNLTIYAAESSVYTYNLIQQSDYVIVFGSTVGVEASYYGKPVICLGKALYEMLDVAYIPKSKNELYTWLDNMSLPPKIKENTYIYGYGIMSIGKRFINKTNGVYDEDYYSISRKQRIVSSGLKVFSKQTAYKSKKLFKVSFWLKLRDKRYRAGLGQTFRDLLG